MNPVVVCMDLDFPAGTRAMDAADTACRLVNGYLPMPWQSLPGMVRFDWNGRVVSVHRGQSPADVYARLTE